MLKTIATVLACFTLIVLQAQEVSPSIIAAGISDDLKKDADAVYRLDEGVLTIISPAEYLLKVHQVITVLNEEGSHYLHHRRGIDKFNKVDEIEIKMFDALGLLIKKYGKKDFETEAAFDGISLFTDDKVMKLNTPTTTYPCTVDVQYTVHATSYVELPNWYINYNHTATELFRYEVSVPADVDIRQRTLNMDAAPQIEIIGKNKHYVWEVKNVVAKKLESNGFEPALYLPQIEIEPNEFSYDGHKGAFHTWEDFGAWNYNLYEEKSPFTEERMAEIKLLVKEARSNEEKINILYQYLQRNMRYVSIQLGIGGFKPFAVKFVDENKYGDCKALTNYMRYLLKAVGINAYPALINAGYDKIPATSQFPSDPFNHVILCIPGEKDTTWLECTSTYSNAGELGTFTENKKALLLTERGGILVNTPASNYRTNRMTTQNEVTITADGGAVVHNKTSSSGEIASYYKYVLQMKEDEQKEQLIKLLHYKSTDDVSILPAADKVQTCFNVTSTCEKFYDFKTGNKYFFPVCFNRLVGENMKLATRETDFVFAYPYIKTDSTVLQFPAGFTPETVPANKELQTPYSYYRRTCRFDAISNKLIVISSFALTQHVIPAASYLKLAQFCNEAMALEEENLVMVKQ